jgi:hypothetical protein
MRLDADYEMQNNGIQRCKYFLKEEASTACLTIQAIFPGNTLKNKSERCIKGRK